MKKFTSYIASLLIFVLCLLSFTSYAFAQSNDNNHDLLARAVYLTNNKESAEESVKEGISTVSYENINSSKVVDSDITIVDFEDLFDNNVFADEVSKHIRNGKKFYVRAQGYSANSDIISKILDIPETNGKVLEADDSGNYARIGTFGYMVFIDMNGNLQIVRQLRAFAEDESISDEVIDTPKQILGTEQTTDDERLKMKKVFDNAPEFTYADEIDAIDSFLTTYSEREILKRSGENTNNLEAQSTFTSYAYEKIYDTTYWYANVRTSSSSTTSNKKIGAITRVMYAKRLYCATANWGNPSYLTSKWAYMSDTYKQPTWSQSKTYRSLNNNLCISYSTFPTGSGNATYKMILRDYTPKVDLSGKTDVTLSVGANVTASKNPGFTGSTGFNTKTSFADVKITVPKWQVGQSYSQNIVQINFAIGGTFDRLSSKVVMTSTISLPSGVVLWNYANKYSCIQVNYSANWYINNGVANTYDTSKTGSGALVWQPAKLY